MNYNTPLSIGSEVDIFMLEKYFSRDPITASMQEYGW